MASKEKKLRVKLRGFDAKVVEKSARMVLDTAYNTGSRVMGPVFLPKRRSLYCVLRSPHVEKRSMEHFEKVTHTCLVDIYDSTSQTTDSLQHLELPAGVGIEVKYLG